MLRTPLALATTILSVAAGGALAAQSTSVITTTGQELTVSISGVPTTLPGTPSIQAICDATLGAATSAPVNVIFVFDCSGSMGAGVSGAGISDFNGDGATDRIDAAGLGFVALLDAIGGAAVEVAIVPFGSLGGNCDMSPDPGQQLFVTPGTDANMNGTDDIIDVLASHDVGGPSLFASVSTGSGTNFNNALTAVNTAIAAQPPAEPTFVFFLTDGNGSLTPPGSGGPLDATIATGAVVNTIGIGPGVSGACAPGGPLDLISSSTGGTCIEEPNPANLSTSLPGGTSTQITGISLAVNGMVVSSQTGMFGNAIMDGPTEIFPLLNPAATNVVECSAMTADGTTATVQVTISPTTLTCIDFETEDDFQTPLVNGQDINTPDEFGVLFDVSGMGANMGPTIFDSTPGGVNAMSQDPDLLVDTGNILILQSFDEPNQSTTGIYDFPNDSINGGTLVFDFPVPVEAASLDLIDIDIAPIEMSTVTLFDAAGSQRTYTIPPNWTGDPNVSATTGIRTLNLTTLDPQPGFGSTATATETQAFDGSLVVRIEVTLGRSGGVDNLKFALPQAPSAVVLDAEACANPTDNSAIALRVVNGPVIGQNFDVELANPLGDVAIAAFFLGLPADGGSTGIAPIPLDAFGSPGCALMTDILSGNPYIGLMSPAGTTVTLADLSIPEAAGIAGLELCLQALAVTPHGLMPTDRYRVTFHH
jgi:hypothetical protein